MSARTTPAKTSLDSLHFARSGEVLSGVYPISELPRLLDLLASDEGTVQYRLVGSIALGRPTLQLSIEAELRLVCQRCLEPYTEALRVASTMPVARDERELARWESEDPLIDALVADPRLDVRTLVEDEILLSLPIMPRHPEAECSMAVG
jgi:uncharacterized protein